MIERDRAKKEILNMTEPFCITDLYYRMGQKGFTNRKMLLQILDELFEIGLVKYIRVNYPNAEWAFVVE